MAGTVAPPDILDRAECIYDADDIELAIDQLAIRITLDLSDESPVVICVMKGGIALTGALLERFSFPLELDYVHATRYRETVGGRIDLRVMPMTDIRERTVLLVDDVLDKGVTLARVVETVQTAGAASVLTAVLVDKDVPKKIFTADYIGLAAPNRYLVGCGMDYAGWFRNLWGIYALDSSWETP
jgi:hypoxanthine phosphoribosyltransferase